MKKISICFFIAFISCTTFTQAQTGKITLNKGQQLKITTAVKANISQMSMETVMDVTSDKSITVKDITGSDYALDLTTTHIQTTMSLMGQDKKFDSDNKDDMAGELKDLGKDINKPIALTLSQDGICKPVASPEKAETNDNPMNGMMQQVLGGGAEEITTATYFMLIPKERKVGDIWTESSETGGTKTSWSYKWESTAEGMATVTATGKEISNTTANAMGMDMTINITNDITETRKVNLSTDVITSNTSTKKISGTIGVMGQDVPITGTSTTTTTIQ